MLLFLDKEIVTVASSCNCLRFRSHEIYNKNFLDYQLQNVPDQEKFQLLTKDYVPSEIFVFPKTKIYG